MPKQEIKSIDTMIEVVVKSIPREYEAHDLYLNASKKAPDEMTRILFETLAEQELAHASKLKAVLKLLQNQKASLKKKD